MSQHSYKLSVRGRAAAVAVGVAALTVGGVLLVLGVTLLLGALAAGVVLAAGLLAYRRLTGRQRFTLRGTRPRPELDPALEVFPDSAVNRQVGDKPAE